MGVREARQVCNDFSPKIPNETITHSPILNAVIWDHCLTSANEIHFMSLAPPRQRTQAMSGLWAQLSTGQMPFLLLNILKGKGPQTKLQTKPQALHLIGRWSW